MTVADRTAYRGYYLDHQQGFTLLELAVVLVIIGLLYTVWSYTLPGLNEEAMRGKTRAIMEETQQSLLAFARTNNRLPCPDTSTPPDGHEGGASGCLPADVVGQIPYETLLLSSPVQDAYHAPITYALYRHGIADLGKIINRIDSMDDVDAANNVTHTKNICDFCEALRNGNVTAGNGFASTSTQITTGGCSSGAVLNQAYVLSSSGLEDADGVNALFDGDNATAPASCFASTQQGRSAAYDDQVTSVSFGSLMGQLCHTPVCLGPNPALP